MIPFPRLHSRVLALACALPLATLFAPSPLRAALASTLHDAMGVGINYGAHFEDDKTNEFTSPIPQAKFATIRQHGFKHVRLPVAWGLRLQLPWAGANTPVQVHDTFMANVKLSVDRALAEGLIVIINTHHEDWFQRYYSKENNARIRLNTAGTDYYTATEAGGGRPAMEIYKDIWREIVATFDGDPKYENVIFEGLNEPRLNDASNLGDFSNAEVNTVNQTVFNLLQDNLNGSARRVYMMTVNDANNARSFKHLTIPTRGGWTAADVKAQLIVTIHYYHTYDWTHAETADPATWGTATEYDEMIDRFDDITPDSAAKFANGSTALVDVKVNIGEFGVRHRKNDPANGENKIATNRDPGDVLEWYRAVAAAAERRGMTYTVWDDKGWFRVFNRDSGSGGSFDWGTTYESEIWKMVTLYKNTWRLTSGLNAGWNLASSSATGWAPWELKAVSTTDTLQRFNFQVDPGAKLGARDELRYPALRNVGAGKFLDAANDGTPGNGNALRSRDDVLDSALDHYVSSDYQGNGAFSLAIPLPATLYLGSGGTTRVIDLPDPAALGTDAVLWQFETTGANSQRWILDQVDVP